MSGTIRLNGSTSGYVELTAPAVAGSTSLELPLDSLQPGLVHLHTESFSAVSSVSMDNVFSSTYDNYRVVLYAYSSANFQQITMNFRSSGSDNSTTNYSQSSIGINRAGSTNNKTISGHTTADVSHATTTEPAVAMLDFYDPANTSYRKAVTGSVQGNDGSGPYGRHFALRFTNAAGFDGFTFSVAANTITGTLRIYGYANS